MSTVYSEKNRWMYKCGDWYKEVDQPEDWSPCPICGLIPLVWEFGNGRFTACGCGESMYRHHSIAARSMGEIYREDGNTASYERHELRDNWNAWCDIVRADLDA